MSRSQESTILTSRNGGLLQCQFVVDALTGLVRNTSVVVGGQVSVPRLNWTYRHFANVEQRSFPDEMQLSLTGTGKNLTAVFSLSNLKWNAKEVDLSKEPGGRYRKVSPEEIIRPPAANPVVFIKSLRVKSFIFSMYFNVLLI